MILLRLSTEPSQVILYPYESLSYANALMQHLCFLSFSHRKRPHRPSMQTFDCLGHLIDVFVDMRIFSSGCNTCI
ncbi:hypothetical protein Agabi119p4_8521 [Agaricus bisporus var. burnettii]|uniref:Uncharacterized protein n=1 Tax=Agaricus bisporus var. burnettii TaxID=192524 RepID=A0A8H7C7B5_AGABI|nr:hypothetical protein Agabi119p4_8521 [Agaricus bisporus var. burnettii]